MKAIPPFAEDAFNGFVITVAIESGPVDSHDPSMIALSQSRGCKNLRGFPISLNMIFICSECYLKNTLKLGGKRCRRLSVKALKGQRALAEKNGMIETEDH